MKILITSLWTQGDGMSGGDNIWISFARYWKKSHVVDIYGSQEAKTISRRSGLRGIKFIGTIKSLGKNNLGVSSLFKNFTTRVLKPIHYILSNRNKFKKYDVVFSASDFWPDIIPALLIKIICPKKKWVSAFYFFAPKPWQENNPYEFSIHRRIIGFFYWLTQLLAYQLIIKWSDSVIACNEIDRQIFIKDGYPADKIISVYGGVDLDKIKKIPQPNKKIYDAVFMARFHPQKGPMVAVKVWEELMKTLPKAKLAMIGNGSEEEQVLSYIKEKKLSNNIKFLGFMDGKEKYDILKSSRIFIHPAIYETGGMAAAEGMACELPVVSFKHDGFKYCYPRGMMTVSPIGDFKKMSKAIIELLTNKKKYLEFRDQAIDLVEKEWDWKKRASFVINHISNA